MESQEIKGKRAGGEQEESGGGGGVRETGEDETVK